MAEQRDEALLLRSIPYSDSSLILHLLTNNHGRIALMARGARRAKSPFRAGLMPLHQLNIRWREPRTGNMGTLIEVERASSPLLPDHKILAGQELIATASKLFPDGMSQGYQELQNACSLLSMRPETSGIPAARWYLLEASGWIGDLQHCWHCVEMTDLDQKMFWRQGHLLCQICANNQGFELSSGFRKTIFGYMQTPNIKLTQEHVSLWSMMIKDIFQTHQLQSQATST